jgi:hypothetical protein
VQQQQQALQVPGRSQAAVTASSDLAEFSWQLQCAHASLLVSVQELLAAGPAAAASAAGAGVSAGADSGSLGRVYALMQQLVSAWQAVKEFEAQAAEEAAQLFKHKTQSKTFLNEEVRGLTCIWCQCCMCVSWYLSEVCVVVSCVGYCFLVFTVCPYARGVVVEWDLPVMLLEQLVNSPYHIVV